MKLPPIQDWLFIFKSYNNNKGIGRKKSNAFVFSCKFDVILIVKGAHSQVYYPDGTIYLNMSGCSALATAGSGDVLCGVIAAQYALGMDISYNFV